MVKRIETSDRAQYYYFKGLEAGRRQELIKALGFAREAKDIEDSYHVRFLIASLYIEMQLYEQAFLEYLRALKIYPNDTALYIGILTCLKAMGFNDEYEFYFDLALKRSEDAQILFESDNDIFIDNFFDRKNPDIKIYNRYDKSRMIKQAQLLAAEGKYAQAREAYSDIDFNDNEYCEAQNSLAMLALTGLNYQSALEHCNNSLSKNPADVTALCTKVMIFTSNEHPKEQIDEILAQLDEVVDKDKKLIANPMLLYLRLAQKDKLLKHLQMAAEQFPYNTNIKLMLAIEYANNQDFKNAVSTLDEVKIIDPQCACADFYYAQFKNSKSGFNPQPYIPLEQAKIWLNEFKKIIKSNNETVFKLITADGFANKLYWYLHFDEVDDKIIVEVIKILTGFKQLRGFFKDVLLYPQIGSWIKCHILAGLLSEGSEYTFSVCDGYYYETFSYRAPKDFNKCHQSLKRAFWLSSAFIRFFSSKAYKKLCENFEKICIALNACGDDNLKPENLNVNTLVAAMSFNSVKKAPFCDIKVCAGLFKCSPAMLKKYLKAFNLV